MSIITVEKTLASAVATSGTFTVAYPTGTNAGTFAGGWAHKMYAAGLQAEFASPAGFTVAFGTAEITVTYLGATSLPADSRVTMEFDTAGGDFDSGDLNDVNRTTKMSGGILSVNLGAPDAADADGVCASQAITAAGTGTIAGALATGGVATFDVPRNVVGAWTNTAVMTVTGTDEYGNVVVENSASGTSMAGKKAFKTITAVDVSANVTGATVGTGDVLGLPVFLARTGDVIKELEDGATATAGTLVAGATATATATTGDVRGTYDPNSAADGAKAFTLLVAYGDPKNMRGAAQYAG
jgi:hypothetical protein